MKNTLLILFFCNQLIGQITPPIGAQLNYNQVMFMYDDVPEANFYKLFLDTYDSLSAKAPSHSTIYSDSNTCTLVKNLKFSKKYV